MNSWEYMGDGEKQSYIILILGLYAEKGYWMKLPLILHFFSHGMI